MPFTLYVDKLAPLNTSHRRRHWSVQHKEAQRWCEYVQYLGMNRPPKPFSVAKVVITRISSRRPDYDNLVASAKPIVDALKKCGVIEDDSPDHLVGGHAEYRWQRGKSGTVVEVTDGS